jgi:hypothetical protein
MKVSKWYSIKEKGDSVIISYSGFNRVKALAVFSIILIIFLLYTAITDISLPLISLIIMLVILFISFGMTFLSDSYVFTGDGDVIRTIGIYPFRKIDRIPASRIQYLETEDFVKNSFIDELTKKKKHQPQKNNYFSLVLVLDDDTDMKLGSYRIYNKSIIKKLEKFYKIY